MTAYAEVPRIEPVAPVEFGPAMPLAEYAAAPQEWTPPAIYDMSSEYDQATVRAKIRNGEIAPGKVRDPIDAIANDLFEVDHPQYKDDADVRAAYVENLKAKGDTYGNWVHFPWSGELVHYPPKEDHRRLRTSRHQDVITAPEQATLYEPTILVAGLSVGSNAVERLLSMGIGGKIITGDPDTITPSNLNRINASFLDVGMSKVDYVARKISEIDPYIEQVHFREGFTPDNLSQLDEHAPNLILEEVDNFGAKAQLRDYARTNHIPLIMATDVGDRSVVDVERYDVPEEFTQPFVGRLEPSEFARLLSGEVTDQERGTFMLKIVGVENINSRLMQSLIRYNNKEQPGLPQLGSTAAMGAALAAVAAREIILGKRLGSGRYVHSPMSMLGMEVA